MKKENVNRVLRRGLSRGKGQIKIGQKINHYPLQGTPD
jgi:hypothetical protein